MSLSSRRSAFLRTLVLVLASVSLSLGAVVVGEAQDADDSSSMQTARERRRAERRRRRRARRRAAREKARNAMDTEASAMDPAPMEASAMEATMSAMEAEVTLAMDEAETTAESEIVRQGDAQVKVYRFRGLNVAGEGSSPQLLYFRRRVRAEFEHPRLPHRDFVPSLLESERAAELE